MLPYHGFCSPPSPSSDSPDDRKMKKPLMEKRRRKRINDSLNELKDFLAEISPLDRSKLEKADILERTVSCIRQLQNRGINRNFVDSSGVYQHGRSAGFDEGFSTASRAVFHFLAASIPHDNNSHQLHLTLVNHLRTVQHQWHSQATPNNATPLTPSASDSSGAESPEPSMMDPLRETPVTSRRSTILTETKESEQTRGKKRVWQPWQ